MKGLKAQIEAEAAVPAKAATRGRPVNPARAMTDETDGGGRVPSRKGKRAYRRPFQPGASAEGLDFGTDTRQDDTGAYG